MEGKFQMCRVSRAFIGICFPRDLVKMEGRVLLGMLVATLAAAAWGNGSGPDLLQPYSSSVAFGNPRSLEEVRSRVVCVLWCVLWCVCVCGEGAMLVQVRGLMHRMEATAAAQAEPRDGVGGRLRRDGGRPASFEAMRVAEQEDALPDDALIRVERIGASLHVAWAKNPMETLSFYEPGGRGGCADGDHRYTPCRGVLDVQPRSSPTLVGTAGRA
jgi:hypothetical protein